MAAEKIQKLLARCGLGSRRACEQLIRAGRVRINDRIATLGERADPALDRILLDGKPLPASQPLTYVALHKPAGVLSSSRSQGGNPTVLDLVDGFQRLFPVGRLDFESEGLILLTNDGDLTHRLTHPRYQHEKEYRVLLDRTPSVEELAAWRTGVKIGPDWISSPCELWLQEPEGEGHWIRVILREGRKRQLRETAAALGLQVRRLIRVRIAGLQLADLAPGEWRQVGLAEILGGAEDTVAMIGTGRGAPREGAPQGGR